MRDMLEYDDDGADEEGVNDIIVWFNITSTMTTNRGAQYRYSSRLFIP